MQLTSVVDKDSGKSSLARRGFLSSAIGLELVIVMIVLVVLGAALLFSGQQSRAAAAEQSNKMLPVRRIVVAGTDGQYLVVLTDACCSIRDLASAETTVVWMRVDEERATAVAGSPADEQILLCRSQGRMDLLDSKTGKNLWHVRLPTGNAIAAAFSPDGTIMAVATDQARMLLIASASGEILRSIDLTEPAHTVCFSPCGGRVIAPIKGTEVGVWDTASGREVRRFPVGRDAATSVAAQSSGDSVAVGTYGGMTLLIDMSTGDIKRQWKTSAFPVMSVAFSPNGEELVSAGCDRHVTVLSPHLVSPLKRFAAHDEAVRSIAFAGEFLLTGGYDGLVRRWDSTMNWKSRVEL